MPKIITLKVKTNQREELIDLTREVRALLAEESWKDGILQLHCPHTTAGLTVNENADPDVVTDILAHLRTLVPNSPTFRHAEGNSDAHIKASLMGCSLTLLVENGQPKLGTWQSPFFCEFDGPRSRKVWATFLQG